MLEPTEEENMQGNGENNNEEVKGVQIEKELENKKEEQIPKEQQQKEERETTGSKQSSQLGVEVRDRSNSEKNDTTKISTQSKQQKQEEVPQQSSSGWGSWGGLWSVASSVVQSVDQYVKPTLVSVTETTKDMVRELIVDEPTFPSKFPRPSSDNKEDKIPQVHQMEKNPDVEIKEDPKEEDDSFFANVDKGVSSAVDYLGSFLQEGIKAASNVTTEDLTAKAKNLQSKAMEVASTSLQKAKEVTTSATETTLKFGEKFAAQSVDTLEAVGKSALELLTVQEEVEGNKKRIRPIFLSAQTAHMTKEEQESFEEVLNRNYFEESNGFAHLQALETLSIECTSRIQKQEQQLDTKQREQLSKMVSVIRKLVEEAEADDTKQLELPEVILNEPAVKQNKNVEAMEHTCKDKAKELIEAYNTEIKELKPADLSAESIITASDICHLTASYLDKALLESVQMVNQFSAVGVEQLLRIAESFLIDALSGIQPDEALKKSTYAFAVALLLGDRLTKISTAFIDSVQVVSEAGKTDCLQFAKKPEAAEESKKCADDLDTKMSLHMNHVYLETSNAISNLEDCRKFLFSISKSLLISSLIGEKGGEQNRPENVTSGDKETAVTEEKKE